MRTDIFDSIFGRPHRTVFLNTSRMSVHMSPGGWSFRTTTSIVTVHDDAITTRSTPGKFIAGQSLRWRHGSRKEQVKAAFRVVGFVASIVTFLQHLSLIADSGVQWASLFYVSSVGFFGYSLWRNYGRQTTISRSAINSVTLDPESRELTVTHREEHGPVSVFRDDITETTFPIATEDDLRKAREALRLRGIEFEPAAAESDTETVHRIVSENGGHHCERCDALVTPNDKVCPNCEYALWVKTNPAA